MKKLTGVPEKSPIAWIVPLPSPLVSRNLQKKLPIGASSWGLDNDNYNSPAICSGVISNDLSKLIKPAFVCGA